MYLSELLEIVEDEPVFETGLLRSGRPADAGLGVQLSRWSRAGKILRLRRGLYALAPPYRKTVPHPFLVANRLVPGSWVSGLSALAFAGAIPEFVPEVTSCGPGRPHLRETALGRFSFRHLKPSLRWGYRLHELAGAQSAFVATPEKALLDLVYLTPGGDDPRWIAELRLAPRCIRPGALHEAARRAGIPKLQRAARCLRRMCGGALREGDRR